LPAGDAAPSRRLALRLPLRAREQAQERAGGQAHAERSTRLKLRATPMAAAGATPPFSLELLRPTLPRLVVLLTFGSAAGKRSNPVRRVRGLGHREATVAATGRARRRSTGRGAPAPPRARVVELDPCRRRRGREGSSYHRNGHVPPVLGIFFMLQLLYTDVATMFLTCCNCSPS
jgi:hypothetical protein